MKQFTVLLLWLVTVLVYLSSCTSADKQVWAPIPRGFGCGIWLDGSSGEDVHDWLGYYQPDRLEAGFLIIAKPAPPEPPFALELDIATKTVYEVQLARVPNEGEHISESQVIKREIFPYRLKDVPFKAFAYYLDGYIGKRQLDMTISYDPRIGALLGAMREMERVERLAKEGAVEPLVDLIDDKNTWISTAAAEALAKIGEPAIEPLFKALREDEDDSIGHTAAEALRRMGEPVVERLIRALGDNHWVVRRTAADALGEIGSKKAAGPLIKALKDAHEEVRSYAAGALGIVGDETAVKPLIAALKDNSDMVRHSSAKSLRKIGDKRAVEPLIQSITSKNRDVRREAIMALGRIGDKRAVDRLIEALKDADMTVRYSAGTALGDIGEKKAIEPLIEKLREEDDAFLYVPEALKKITNQDFGTDYSKWKAWYEKNKDK